MGFYFYVVMILIISQNHIDEPTNDVIDWLRYIGYTNFIRINGEDYHMDRVFTSFRARSSFAKGKNQ